MRRVFLLLILAALLLVIITTGAGVSAANNSASNAAAIPDPADASAQNAQGTGIYVVRRGDTLFSIASRHCMTTTELFNLNSSILTNPNQIYVGMQLRVINRCGGGGGGGGSGGNWGGVCDRGPSQHAQGTVSGNRYLVARGDTSFSIANRFGISVTALCQANGINPWTIFAGQTLVIPGLTGSCSSSCGGNWNCPPNNCWNCPPPTAVPPCWNCQPTAVPPCWNCQPTAVPPCWNCRPTAVPPCWNCQPTAVPPCWNCQPTAVPPCWNCRPTVVPITPQPTAITPFLQIDSPRSGETVPATFTVSGRGGGLFEGNVLIQAFRSDGGLLAQQTTILQGSDVGAGGSGTFSAQLTVPSLTAVTPGWIVVSSPQSRVNPVFAQVFFSPGP